MTFSPHILHVVGHTAEGHEVLDHIPVEPIRPKNVPKQPGAYTYGADGNRIIEGTCHDVPHELPERTYPLDPADPAWPAACDACPYNTDGCARCVCV